MDSALPAYAVPGIEPMRVSDDLTGVSYHGHQLAACAAVTAVLERIPAVLTTVEEAWPGHTVDITRDELCAWLFVGTGDGVNWVLSFRDAVGYLVQAYQSRRESDPELLQEALAAQPGVDSAVHHDTNNFEVRMARPHRADEMLARWLDAIMTAHREFGRRRR